MSEYLATVYWERKDEVFTDNRYSRAHRWSFDGGLDVPASSSPQVVPLPLSDPRAVDPEEAFIASLSSCHMLWFLSLAARKKFVVDVYEDRATGELGKNQAGKSFMKTVTLNPRVLFSGDRRPTQQELEALHHQAHEECFIASSVITEVRCQPVLA